MKNLTAAFQSFLSDKDTPDADAESRKNPALEASEQIYRIEFRPHRNLFSIGANPVLYLDELRALGPCEIKAQTDEIPPLNELIPDESYFSWDIHLTTKHAPDAVREVFEFIEDYCLLDIQTNGNDIPDEIDESLMRLCEKLVDDGFITVGDFNSALEDQSKIGDLLVDSGVVSKEDVTSGLDLKRVITHRNIISRTGTIRVASDKLDNLVNLIGELVITQSRISQIAKAVKAPNLKKPLKTAEHLTNELRDCILNIRMIPIGITFSKFRRYVRDMSGQLGKEIDLVMEGAETELDKTVIERLEEPLVHLIRNSIDHGFELPDVREKTGKPRRGTVRLSAAHKGEIAVISIEDDGAGLDAEKIFEKAVERELVSDDAALSEFEIQNLLFLPGFSTSSQVTSISGRGVGMDIVKRAIDSLRGSMRIDSEKGRGTKISLSLPMTLSIIDGLLVRAGKSPFILPMDMVVECIDMTKKLEENAHGRNMALVRGEVIPFFRLRDQFNLPGGKPENEQIVIVQSGNRRTGIVVDEVIGDHQTVIKNLGKVFRQAKGVSGATIMGDGTVALILDAPGLCETFRESEIEQE